MAEILPIKGWRYASHLTPQLEDLTAPLFDVVSSKQRQKLYANPLNSIHLSVPQGIDPAKNAAEILRNWKSTGVISQDLAPSIYVYYQYFRIPGEREERCRKGFIAQIKAYDWSEKIILRHENTIGAAVNDRTDLLRETEIQVSPTHGLYIDEKNLLEKWMDQAILNPIYDLEDYQGVREVLSLIQDPELIAGFVEVMSQKQIILADGHHRLQGAIDYRKEKSTENVNTQWKASDYHMMYFTNTSGNHLKILPTHRLFEGLALSKDVLLEKLGEWFTIRKFDDPEELGSYTFQRKWSFGMLIEDESYILKLKEERFSEVRNEIPLIVRQLDLVILHDVLFDKILGIPEKIQKNSAQLSYERNFSRILQDVQTRKASFAIITREIELSQVLEVCKTGEVLPQKSTYFYPKALGGLVFGTINQQEFDYDYGIFFKKTDK
jgi:uncharacterized protein (DUF1015 family)